MASDTGAFKSWGFTDFNLDLDTWERLAPDVNRMVVGLEYTEDGKEHLQGSITFKRSWRKAGLMRMINGEDGCTWKKAKTEDFHIYSGKDKAILIDVNNKHQGVSDEINVVLDKIKTGTVGLMDIRRDHTRLYLMRHAGIDKLVQGFQVALARPEVEVRWYWGSSGAGKTHTAELEAGIQAWYMTDMTGQWFDGYSGEEHVVLNEFRGEMPFGKLLKLLEKSPVRVFVKGGSLPWNARKIWITSPMHPLECYKDVNEDLYQLTRRIHILREYTGNFKSGTHGYTESIN